MSSEERELNDKDILTKTSVETGENGQMQRYVTALPSGRKLESNWMTEQDRKRALIQWTNAVRAEALADIETAKGAAREELRQIRKNAPTAIVDSSGKDFGPIQTAYVPSMSMPAAQSQSGLQPASIATDPLAYMKQQLQAAVQSQQYWQAQAAIAKIEEGKATAQVNQWAAALKAITGVDISHEPTIFIPQFVQRPVNDDLDTGFVPVSDSAPKFEPVEHTGETTEIFYVG